MKSPSIENRVFMSTVMAVTGSHPAGMLVVPNIEGGLQIPPAQVAEETRAQTAYRLAWEERLRDAHRGRLALAERYAGCAVTSVVDTHVSGYVKGTEHVPRNKVVVTVDATATPEATTAEDKYANGQPRANDVTWHHFSGGGSAETQRRYRDTGEKVMLPIPTGSESISTGQGRETFTVTFFPRIDERSRTTNATIALNTDVETHADGGELGLEGNVSYRSTGSIICGRLVETEGLDGQHQWSAFIGPDVALGARTTEEAFCEFVPLGGNSYDKQCD